MLGVVDKVLVLRADVSELFGLRDQLLSALKPRTVAAAPIAGTVVELRFTTPGGVVGPGEPILNLVPAKARLLIEARVRPQGIDDVASRRVARVVRSAYKQRNLPQIYGRVRDVSADRLADERSGEAYSLPGSRSDGASWRGLPRKAGSK